MAQNTLQLTRPRYIHDMAKLVDASGLLHRSRVNVVSPDSVRA